MTETPALLDFAELDRPALEEVLAGLGAPRFRGRQIFHWIHRRDVTSFAEMTNLGHALQAQLSAVGRIGRPEIVTRQTSSDGTTKFLLALGDGQRIEAVYIPDTPAQTFCVSTQVGCAMACAFCLTGQMGLVRHLTAGEIAGQVRLLAHETGLASTPFNVVLMGMGEPLHNYEPTMSALRMLADEQGLGVHPRRVTLSTVGILPALERLAGEAVMPNLAISLHGTTDQQRTALVPPNRRYPIADLIAACRRFPQRRRGRITFEYVLLAGVNDSPADARRLGQLLGDMRAKVNLLPLNEAAGIPFTRPADDVVERFARALLDRGVAVSVRRSRGRDIRAACGQLIVEGTRPSAGQRAAARLRAEPTG